ncbi:MAG: hypothetical protein F7C35_01025 [Desulfurococcales archaeon]|nr:hypothetical protein [Desulfurococcales archaeon]
MVATTCEVCLENPGEYRCKVCGRIVCRQHYNPETGTCTFCEELKCQICGKRPSLGYCLVCGRLGCDLCLIQVDNVRRVCRECLEKYGMKGIWEILKSRRISEGPLRVVRRVIGL